MVHTTHNYKEIHMNQMYALEPITFGNHCWTGPPYTKMHVFTSYVTLMETIACLSSECFLMIKFFYLRDGFDF